MTYSRGTFQFSSGLEEETAYRWLWTCLLDTSLLGRMELVCRILFFRPPRRFMEILDEDENPDSKEGRG